MDEGRRTNMKWQRFCLAIVAGCENVITAATKRSRKKYPRCKKLAAAIGSGTSIVTGIVHQLASALGTNVIKLRDKIWLEYLRWKLKK